MKTKRAICNLFVVLLATTVLQAGDSWKNKPHTEWSAEEALQVLNNSPWVRAIIPLSPLLAWEGDPAAAFEQREAKRKQSEREWRRAQLYPQQRQDVIARDISRRVDDLHRLERRRGTYPRPAKLAPVGVRWLSSRTMQRAIVRSKEFVERADEKGIRSFLSLVQNYHAIAIGDAKWVEVGSPLVLKKPVVSEARLNEVSQSTYLELQPSKRKIFPVAVVSLSFGLLEPDLVLLFPRQIEGRATIGPQEKKVKFLYSYSGSLVVEFDLSKMTRDGKPDL